MYRKYFYQSDTITSNIAPKLPLGKCQKCNPMFEADKKKNPKTPTPSDLIQTLKKCLKHHQNLF